MEQTKDPYNPMDRYQWLLDNNSELSLKEDYWDYYNDIYIRDERGKNGLGDTNEEYVWRNNGKTFLPGKMYTYSYNPLYKDVLSFYDRRPIMFCIGVSRTNDNTGNTLVTGLNLAFLPPNIRMSFLGDFWIYFNGLIDHDMKAIYKYKQNSMWEKIPSLFGYWKNRITKLNSYYSAAFQFATRKYIIVGPDGGRMDNIRLMEYQHWHYVGLLDSPKYLTGATPNEIWNRYYQLKRKKK